MLLLGSNACLGQLGLLEGMRHSMLTQHHDDSMAYYYDQWLHIAVLINHDSLDVDLNNLNTIRSIRQDPFVDAIYLLHYASSVAQKSGNYERGLELSIEALAIFDRLNAKNQQVHTLCQIAFFKLWNEIGVGNTTVNEQVLSEHLEPALSIAQESKNVDLIIKVYQWIGSYYIVSKNDRTKALEYFIEAERLGANSQNTFLKLGTIASLGIVYAELCDEKNMFSYLDKFLADPFAIHFPYALGNLHRSISRYFLDCANDPQQALGYANLAYTLAQKMNALEYLNLAQKRLYEVHKRLGNVERAMHFLELSNETDSKMARSKFEFAYSELNLESKERVILEQRMAITRKNTYLFLILGSVVCLGGLLFVIARMRKNKRLLDLQEAENHTRKQIEEAVLASEEDERRRIADNLHDSVVQKLVVAKMNVVSLQRASDHQLESEKIIMNNIHDLINESTTEIRQLSHTLMPADMQVYGLGKVVKEFALRMFGTEVKLEVFERGNLVDLPKNIAVVAYRMTQECIQNALKHANPTLIAISLEFENNWLEILVEDNGSGFDSKQESLGQGLKSIQSRVDQLNGQFYLESSIGRGTSIHLKIPVLC